MAGVVELTHGAEFGQMTERKAAKRPNGKPPNDRTKCGQMTERW